MGLAYYNYSIDKYMSQSYKGFVDRITYHNPDTGYTIARLAVESERERVTIVGALASIQEGENVVS